MSTGTIVDDPPPPRIEYDPEHPYGIGTPIVIDDDVGPITSLITFDMRNGDISDARSLIVKATVAPAWHWRPIHNLAPSDAVKQTPAFIRTALAGLKSNMPPGMSEAQARKAAIVMGTARAVTTEIYRIQPQDLIPGESAQPLLSATYAETSVPKLSELPDLPTEARKALTDPLNLTTQEKAAVASAHMSAIGILPVQGYSLVMTGHHYLSDIKTQSRKAFDVIERQNWKSENVASWWQDDAELLRDALWHKACHPVSMLIKTQLAYDDKIPKMLIAAGAGPAASRLPALESEVRAASSYRTLLQTVRPMFEACGARVDFSVLDDAIAVVKLFPTGARNENAPVAPPPILPTSVPPYLSTRAQAVEYLSTLISGHTDIVAHAYGFYCALSDHNQTLGGGTAADTLKTSYSLTKLKNQSYAAFVAGQQAHGDYLVAKARERNEGRFKAQDLVVYAATVAPPN